MYFRLSFNKATYHQQSSRNLQSLLVMVLLHRWSPELNQTCLLGDARVKLTLVQTASNQTCKFILKLYLLCCVVGVHRSPCKLTFWSICPLLSFLDFVDFISGVSEVSGALSCSISSMPELLVSVDGDSTRTTVAWPGIVAWWNICTLVRRVASVDPG